MNIRIANESDLPELAALFRETVLAHAPQHYTLDQTNMWASFGDNITAFHSFILGVTTYVALDNTGIVGFASIGDDGHIASTYVRYDYLHQGVGSSLMRAVLDHAQKQSMGRLYAEASKFSLGLFKKFGFCLYDTEVVDRSGVQFKRYLVEKTYCN